MPTRNMYRPALFMSECTCLLQKKPLKWHNSLQVLKHQSKNLSKANQKNEILLRQLPYIVVGPLNIMTTIGCVGD
jgi:hypothetical protein